MTCRDPQCLPPGTGLDEANTGWKKKKSALLSRDSLGHLAAVFSSASQCSLW